MKCHVLFSLKNDEIESQNKVQLSIDIFSFLHKTCCWCLLECLTKMIIMSIHMFMFSWSK